MTTNSMLERLTAPIIIRNYRPNIVNHLILRMGLGLFASMLPMIGTWFIISFYFTSVDATINHLWQVSWAGALASAVVYSLVMSIIAAAVIHAGTYKKSQHHRYGQFSGRVATIVVIAMTMIVPYFAILFRGQHMALPIILMAFCVPIFSFAVLSMSIQHYLLRLRIWYDQKV